MLGGKHKSDPVDATGLANLLRTNQFPLAYAYPSQMRGVRDLLRRRLGFVRRRAGTLTHFQCSLHQEGCTEPLRNKLQYKSTRDSLVHLACGKDTRKILESDLVYIKSLDTLIADLEKTALERAKMHNPKHLAALQTIPGCGEITAMTTLYEVHDINRFRSPQRFSSYSRVIRADNESAGKYLGGSSKDKIGNPYLKWAISEIGSAMVRVCTPVRAWHQDQSKKHGKVGAHGRLRHKLAVTIHQMLKHDRVFDLEQFVGKQYMGAAESANPAHNRAHKSGPESEPPRLIGADPPAPATIPGAKSSLAQQKRRGRPPLPRDIHGQIVRQQAAVVAPEAPQAPLPNQQTPVIFPDEVMQQPKQHASTPAKRRGRPPLPRDNDGRILRQEQGNVESLEQPVSPAHNRTELSGPHSEPHGLIEPPAAPFPSAKNHANQVRRPQQMTQRREPQNIRPLGAQQQPALEQLLREQLAAASPAVLSRMLLSILSNVTTGAANPTHNWSSHGPDNNTQLPSPLIGAAPVAFTLQETAK